MKTSTCLFAILIAFIFSSCGMFKDVSIEKRHYRKGYYVQVRNDREDQKIIVKENQKSQESVVVEKTTVENSAVVVENIAQPTPTTTAVKSFSKENLKHSSPPVAFEKSGAVFREKISSGTPKPVEPAPAHDDEEHAIALFLLIILAIILPPLAVLLVDGVGVHFLIDLIFWLLGYGFVIFIPGGGFIYLGIFGLIAIIYALFVVFDII